MTPYEAGYDCGKNGANTANCHFSIFGSAENTKEWERGKRDADSLKEHQGMGTNLEAVK